MIGQDIPNARSVILLIEDANGRQYGWRILNPADVRWEMTGVHSGNEGTQARITASGSFHRISKSPESREIEARMNATAAPLYDMTAANSDRRPINDAEARMAVELTERVVRGEQ